MTDKGESFILVLLDFSTAFDTVNHSILVQHLETWVGLKGTDLNLLRSYLSNRAFFSDVIGKLSPSVSRFSLGVPQGSVLDPLLFSIIYADIRSLLSIMPGLDSEGLIRIKESDYKT